MARRANPAAGPAASTEHAEQPPMQGGSPGVIPEAVQQLSDPTKPVASAYREPAPDAPPPPHVPRFRVVNGGNVMYGGCRTIIRVGKEVDGQSYDLDLLRKQGIILQEIE